MFWLYTNAIYERTTSSEESLLRTRYLLLRNSVWTKNPSVNISQWPLCRAC